MIHTLSPVSDAAALAASRQTSPTMLFSWDLHVFRLPETVDPFVVHRPAGCDQLLMHTRTSIPRPVAGDPPHLFEETRLIGTLSAAVSLRTPRLTKYPAGSTLGNVLGPQTTAYLFYGPSPTFGGYQFPFAASLRISMSSACSATSFFRRAFSFCSAFSSLAISGCIPPYF